MEIRGFLTNLGKYNEGYLVGEWVTFPIDEDEQEEILARIGINEEYEEYFFTDWEGYDFGQYVSIEYVNEIAERIDKIGDDDLIGAMFEVESSEIERVLKRIEGGRYFWYGKDSTIYEIAQRYMDEIMESFDVPDVVKRHINYDSYADELEDSLKETSYGVIELL